jgi:hypothetical protein
MVPEKFNLRALERHVMRSVDELVDDCFPLKHRESLEGIVSAAFGTHSEIGLCGIAIELVTQNYARLTGTYRVESFERGKRVVRDAKVVAEALWDFSPRTWAFRLDIVHMRAETEGSGGNGETIVSELLAQWKRLPSHARFRYRPGVFFLALNPLPALAVS